MSRKNAPYFCMTSMYFTLSSDAVAKGATDNQFLGRLETALHYAKSVIIIIQNMNTQNA
jgi:hypothetical protein